MSSPKSNSRAGKTYLKQTKQLKKKTNQQQEARCKAQGTRRKEPQNISTICSREQGAGSRRHLQQAACHKPKLAAAISPLSGKLLLSRPPPKKNRKKERKQKQKEKKASKRSKNNSQGGKEEGDAMRRVFNKQA